MYNEYSKKNGINKVAIAYRTNLKKNNIHFSCDVFKFLNGIENAFVIVADFSNFFDSLDHKYLKECLKEVLDVNILPNDYYKIFKSITNYAYIEYDDVLAKLEVTHKKLIQLKKERLFEIKEFREFKKEHIHVNTEKYGMVQGSAISSVMSNIYMIKFDKTMNNFITSLSGMYRRYSDDIIIVIPNDAQLLNRFEKIMSIISSVPRLALSPNKTKCYVKQNKNIMEINIKDNKKVKENAFINYLGFSYDGSSVKIREKTISKFYRKMYSRIKTINKYTVLTGRNIGRRKLYKQYSYLGKESHNARKR